MSRMKLNVSPRIGPLLTFSTKPTHCTRCPHRVGSLSAVSGRTSPWLNRLATSFRTTSSVTSYTPSGVGLSCRRRAALTATSTATVVGPSAPCGVRAMAGTWSGAAIAAQPFTHRSRDRTAESAIEVPYPYGTTSKSAHQAPERPPGEVWVVVSANLHVTTKVRR